MTSLLEKLIIQRVLNAKGFFDPLDQTIGFGIHIFTEFFAEN